MSYTSAPATVLLATNCCVCGRPLVDSISVSLGIGPECRGGATGGISPEVQEAANKITYLAAIAAQEGKVEEVRGFAQSLRDLGLDTLANKVAKRFVNAEKKAKIEISVQGDRLSVVTPFRRGDKEAYIQAWRDIPGRRYAGDGVNTVPVSEKQRLWALLREFFPGQFAMGPKGVFKIPGAE